jgi:hypothetical protein
MVITNSTQCKVRFKFHNDIDFRSVLAMLEQLQCPVKESVGPNSAGTNQLDYGPARSSSVFSNDPSPFKQSQSQLHSSKPPSGSLNVSDPFFGAMNGPMPRNFLSRTYTTPSRPASQGNQLHASSSTSHFEPNPFQHVSSYRGNPQVLPADMRSISAPLQHPQSIVRTESWTSCPTHISEEHPTSAPFLPTESWISSSSRIPDARPITASSADQHPASNSHEFLIPARPSSPMKPSNLPVNITPYLPPVRDLPFGPKTVAKTNAIANGGASRPSTAGATLDISSSRTSINCVVSSDVPRPSTAAPHGTMSVSHASSDTTVSSPSKSPLRMLAQSIGYGRPQTASSDYFTANGSGFPSDNIAADENGETVNSKMPGPLANVERQENASNETTTETPLVSQFPVTNSSASKSKSIAATSKKRAAPSEAGGTNPPARKRAQPRKKTTTAPPLDNDALVAQAFRDYDITASMQDFRDQRPGSGRRQYVEDMILRHIMDDGFVEFCETVENVWARTAIEHPSSERSTQARRKARRENLIAQAEHAEK